MTMTIGPSTAAFFKVQRIIKCRLQEVSKTSNSPIFLSNYHLPFLPSETLHTYFVLPGKSTCEYDSAGCHQWCHCLHWSPADDNVG